MNTTELEVLNRDRTEVERLMVDISTPQVLIPHVPESQSEQINEHDLPQPEVVQINFTDLINQLREFERQFEYSTVDMLEQVLTGDSEYSSDLDNWFHLYILLLRTDEMYNYVCD